MRQISSAALAIAICCAFAPPAAGADAGTYTVVTLPTLGGTRTQGDSINNRGWVAGFSTHAGDLHRHGNPHEQRRLRRLFRCSVLPDRL